MTTSHRVWVDSADNRVVAVHPIEQIIPDDAYNTEGRVCMVAVLPMEVAPGPMRDLGKDPQTNMPRFEPVYLPSGWQEDYPPPVPPVITNTAGKLALLGVDLLDDVEGLIDAMPAGPQKQAIQIHYAAANWYRSNPMFDELGAMLTPALTPTDIDNLFRAAVQQ